MELHRRYNIEHRVRGVTGVAQMSALVELLTSCTTCTTCTTCTCRALKKMHRQPQAADGPGLLGSSGGSPERGGVLPGYQGAAPDDNFQNDPEDECQLQAPPMGTAAPFLGPPPPLTCYQVSHGFA